MEVTLYENKARGYVEQGLWVDMFTVLSSGRIVLDNTILSNKEYKKLITKVYRQLLK